MKRSLAVFGVLGAAGLAVFIALYDDVFPQASLHIDVNHAQAEQLAREYVEKRGFQDLLLEAGWQEVTIFSSDVLPQIYLQKTWGIDRFNQEIERDPDLAQWWYGTRFFRSLDEEEFTVWVDTLGRVVSFEHVVPDTTSGAMLSKDEARVLAEAFMQRELKVATGQYEEKDYSVRTFPNRTDHHFSFQEEGSGIPWSLDPNTGVAAKRIDVVLQGREIGGFHRFLFIPEDFVRHQQLQESYGILFVVLAGAAFLFLVIASIVVLLQRYKASDLRPRFVYWLAGILIVLNVLDFLGVYDTALFEYPTAEPLSTFLIIIMVGFLVGVGVVTAGLLLMGTTGESLTRAVFPHANDLDPQKRHALRNKWWQLGLGVGAGCMLLGYITLFYYVATRSFGVWSPLEAGIVQYMSSRFPFISPIALSLSAAVTEEISCRYFGVSFIKKYAKSTFLSLLIPGIIWAFLHSNYSVYPMYVRGIELTVAGMFLGWIFLRYGIFTAIVAHYTIDAILFSLPLLLSRDLSLRISGVLPLLFLLTFPFFYVLLQRGRASVR